MANRTKLTPKKKAELTDLISRGHKMVHACRLLDISRTAVHEHKHADPEFAAKLEAAWEEGTQTLEEEARRRAHDGVVKEKGVYHNGEMVGMQVETEYSDTLLMFLLKSRRPEVYRERSETKLTGDPSAPIHVIEFRRREVPDGR